MSEARNEQSLTAPGDSLAREKPVEPPYPDMVWIPGGTFRMGSDQHYPEEAPAHRVTVDGFWMDAYPVTNTRFREFVEVTGHTTFAEVPPNPEDYPGAIPEMMYAGSLVFEKPPVRVDLRDSRQWWSFVRGADWLHPRGSGSTLKRPRASIPSCTSRIRTPKRTRRGSARCCRPRRSGSSPRALAWTAPNTRGATS